jgi:hypothetical protein
VTVIDTAEAIKAIDVLTAEKCAVGCWCTSAYLGGVASHNRYTWSPGDIVVRFPPEETL